MEVLSSIGSTKKKGAKKRYLSFRNCLERIFFRHNSFHGKINATNSLAFSWERKKKETKTNWNSIFEIFSCNALEIIDILKANVAHEVWSSCKMNWTVRCRRAPNHCETFTFKASWMVFSLHSFWLRIWQNCCRVFSNLAGEFPAREMPTEWVKEIKMSLNFKVFADRELVDHWILKKRWF